MFTVISKALHSLTRESGWLFSILPTLSFAGPKLAGNNSMKFSVSSEVNTGISTAARKLSIEPHRKEVADYCLYYPVVGSTNLKPSRGGVKTHQSFLEEKQNEFTSHPTAWNPVPQLNSLIRRNAGMTPVSLLPAGSEDLWTSGGAYKDYGELVKTLRQRLGLSVDLLAHRAGIAECDIHALEQGSLNLVQAATTSFNLAKSLRVEPQELITILFEFVADDDLLASLPDDPELDEDHETLSDTQANQAQR